MGWTPGSVLRAALLVLVAAATVAVLDEPVASPMPKPAPRPVTGTLAPPKPDGPTALGHFAPGACLAYPPAGGDRGRTVLVDAGHGGPDPGTSAVTTTGPGLSEKDATLPVALASAQLLRSRGYRVVLSRTTDSTVIPLAPDDLDGNVLSAEGKHADLLARATCANLAGAAALISIHFDGYPDSSVGGALTLYDAARPFSAASLALATLLQQNLTTALAANGTPVTNRGVTTDDTAGGGEITAPGTAYGHLTILGPRSPGYVDDPSQMPAALVEPLFLTNPAECAIAASVTGQQVIAGAIADAVTAFLTG